MPLATLNKMSSRTLSFNIFLDRSISILFTLSYSCGTDIEMSPALKILFSPRIRCFHLWFRLYLLLKLFMYFAMSQTTLVKCKKRKATSGLLNRTLRFLALYSHHIFFLCLFLLLFSSGLVPPAIALCFSS